MWVSWRLFLWNCTADTISLKMTKKFIGSIYRVSHQYGNTFNFNFLILYQCYCKSKTSSEKLRFKPSRGHLDFDFFQKIRLFFRVGKKRNKNKKKRKEKENNFLLSLWRFGSKLFRRGFTFAVALIQNEKIKVECVSILMGHPVYVLRCTTTKIKTNGTQTYVITH